ncbi:hypothetical protein J2T09_004178, partial [Neorhizobium huautlense]|nr:hypothetical protein [Neorhizobium huautlense]
MRLRGRRLLSNGGSINPCNLSQSRHIKQDCERHRHHEPYSKSAYRVSPRFVNKMMILHRSSGSLKPATQGHPPGSKLSPH